jgi:hypothetical protein
MPRLVDGSQFDAVKGHSRYRADTPLQEESSGFLDRMLSLPVVLVLLRLAYATIYSPVARD